MTNLRQVILHVGGDKTGSTTLQQWFDSNRAHLSNEGIYYPPGEHHALFAAYFSSDPMTLDHYKVRLNHYNPEQVTDQAERYITKLQKNLSANRYDTLVLSYEGFLGLSESELQSVRSFLQALSDRITVIYYLRPHRSYATSAISQRIRFGQHAWYQHPPVTLYIPRIKCLSSVFGKESIVLKRFAKDTLKNGDIIDDFTSAIGLPENVIQTLERPASQANRSLSESAILIGDQMVKLLREVSGPTGASFQSLFADTLERINGEPYRLSPLQIEIIRRAVSNDHQQLLKEYGIDLAPPEELPPTPDVTTLNSVSVQRSTSYEAAHQLARSLIAAALPKLSLPNQTKAYVPREHILESATGEIQYLGPITPSRDNQYQLKVQVTNHSKQWWGGEIAPVCLSYHWLNNSGETVEFEGKRTILPNEGVNSGESRIIELAIAPPQNDGQYLLEITLVQEFFNWLENLGLQTCRIPVTIKNGLLIQQEKEPLLS